MTDTVLILPPAWGIHQPSYALALLAAGMKERGLPVRCYDLNIEMHRLAAPDEKPQWEDENSIFWVQEEKVRALFKRHSADIARFLDRVCAEQPKLVGFSVNCGSKFFSLLLAERLKAKAPSVYVLFGGPDVFRAETGLAYLDSPAVDAVCTGEADRCFPAFAQGFLSAGAPPEVPGFVFKKPDGRLGDTGDPELITDLDTLPFADYSHFDFDVYARNDRIALSTSRGCVNRCTYCSESPNFKRYRSRSAKSVFREVCFQVGRMQAQRVYIHFCDSLVNGTMHALDELCDLIIAGKGRIPSFIWGGLMCLREEMTKPFLKKMYDAGCREISWGLESGCARVLELMRKRYTPDVAYRVIRDAHEIGFYQTGNIIVGFPGETELDFHETIEFVKKTQAYLNAIGVPMMELRRNSYVYDHPDEFGLANREQLHWRTTDDSNTYELRLARMRLIHEAIGNRLFTQGKFDDEIGLDRGGEGHTRSHAEPVEGADRLLHRRALRAAKAMAKRLYERLAPGR